MTAQELANGMLPKLAQHPILGKSKPEWDGEFITILIETYGYEPLRKELNKIHLWCLANPDRAAKKKNWRRFVLNWMNGRERKFVLESEK